MEKTLYLLAYVQDESYRRRILMQFNRGEGRYAVARAVFHGKKGELRQRYREGMKDRFGAIGLAISALILQNTRYLQQALEEHQATEGAPELGNVARLSPLLHEHVNMLGRSATWPTGRSSWLNSPNVVFHSYYCATPSGPFLCRSNQCPNQTGGKSPSIGVRRRVQKLLWGCGRGD